MTLIVSMRIPDGIVLAGDSLATMNAGLEIEADIEVKCPSCEHEHHVQGTIGGIPMAATTLSFAQKVFPFLDEYGVGTFGLGQLMGKTVYFAMRELEKQLVDRGGRPKDVLQAAEKIGKHAYELLTAQLLAENKDIKTQPDNWEPLGFQVVGYQSGKALTIEVHVGKEVKLVKQSKPGPTVSGRHNVVQALWELYQKSPQEAPVFEVFSLQDAISYAEFLISTTTSHQKFSRTIPSVGGEIDIALITPFDHFKWIRQKSLQAKLMEART